MRIERLVGGVVVTNEDSYVRNHFPVPTIDISAWRFRVHGLVRHPLSFSLRDLMNLPEHSMLLTLECAYSFERSLQLEGAEERPVLLAYAMNGEPLPVTHGHPLRAIVPGWYSVTAVKWLHAIEVISGPFTSYFQTERYIYDWQHGREPVRHQRVRSLITHPADGDRSRARL